MEDAGFRLAVEHGFRPHQSFLGFAGR
jgi:hypothetical protein